MSDATIYKTRIYRTAVHRNNSLSNGQFTEPAVYPIDNLSNRQFIERHFVETTI